jgi:hypothetical protein
MTYDEEVEIIKDDFVLLLVQGFMVFAAAQSTTKECGRIFSLFCSQAWSHRTVQ